MDPLPQWISAEHLNAVLQRAGFLAGAHVRHVELVRDRETILSRIIRVRLSYDRATQAAPACLILKTGRPDRMNSEWAGSRHEVAFYRQIAPSLPAKVVPRCLEADHDDATHAWHLLLEDLTDTHALATEWPLPPTRAQCETILTGLGRFHAAWWDDPRLGVSVGAAFDDAAIDRFIEQVAGHFVTFADRLGEDLSADHRAFYQRLLESAPVLHRRYRVGANLTLTHGDAHVWNCFLSRDDSDDARWFDWDSWRIRVPANDLANMMALHWYPDRRTRLESALLDHYHNVLLAWGVTGYDRRDLQDDYRLSVLWQSTMPIFQAGVKIPPVVWWNHFHRIMAAVDDLGCRELLG
jgi:hypothetical protein